MLIAQVEQLPPSSSQLFLQLVVPALELLVSFPSIVHLSLQSSTAESRSCNRPAKPLDVFLEALDLGLLVRYLPSVFVLVLWDCSLPFNSSPICLCKASISACVFSLPSLSCHVPTTPFLRTRNFGSLWYRCQCERSFFVPSFCG